MSASRDAEPADSQADDAAEAGQSESPARSRWRRLPGIRAGSRARFALVGAVVAVTGIAGGVLYWTHGAATSGGEVVVDLDVLVLHPLPEVVTDLSGSGRPAYVKLVLLVQIAERHLPELVENEHRIMDAVQTQLRQYRRDELMGRAGSERLRADLLAAVNRAIHPAKAEDVLFRELLVN